ncbi:hypothetical protein E2562_003377 [Oryza meyeriana var. granulata]|uniref:Uncharacterized protein n=1 Tax=Oryza meyeriana var. granulata TaxID=110450 RepID=A0A6G1EGS7_9ORYZ|nr:hypothetical protein E2562_003377 [Oryza meyeriana var. granulata]
MSSSGAGAGFLSSSCAVLVPAALQVKGGNAGGGLLSAGPLSQSSPASSLPVSLLRTRTHERAAQQSGELRGERWRWRWRRRWRRRTVGKVVKSDAAPTEDPVEVEVDADYKRDAEGALYAVPLDVVGFDASLIDEALLQRTSIVASIQELDQEGFRVTAAVDSQSCSSASVANGIGMKHSSSFERVARSPSNAMCVDAVGAPGGGRQFEVRANG